MIFEGDPRSGIAFEEIKYGNIPGIESVICPKTATVKMTGKYIMYYYAMIVLSRRFAPIDQGDWFTTPGIKQDDIVACGYLFEDYSLGSQITVDFGWDTPLPFTFTIVGKKNEPSYLPRLACKVIMSLQWICFHRDTTLSSSGIKRDRCLP